MRLNKFISHNTNYSRREADELIGRGKEKSTPCYKRFGYKRW